MLTNQNHRLQKLWWSNVTRIKRIASVWVRARFSHEHSVSIICYRYNPFWWESICQERCQDARPRYCVHVPWFFCLFGITDSHRLSNTGPIHTNLEIFETAYLFIRIRVDGALARGRGGRGGVQVARMIEWGQKSIPKKILDQNLTSKKPHAEFP